jgi:hypothetical protein
LRFLVNTWFRLRRCLWEIDSKQLEDLIHLGSQSLVQLGHGTFGLLG